MSGTSLDAIDAALVEFPDDSPASLIQAINFPLPPAIRAEIELICQPGNDEINRMGALDRRLGELFAEASIQLLDKAGILPGDVRAIGSHGQTIRHHPHLSTPFTLQIGDPNVIALRTGITTVADFRRMDMACGGQGAPLVPAFHDAVLRSPQENRVIVNIGGMANISVLAQGFAVTGFDTGPGNVLMDSWIQARQQQPYDRNGGWAASGQCHQPLLDILLAHPYMKIPPPKSTGRETFHTEWLASVLTDFPDIRDQDVQRSLLEFTAQSISDAITGLGIPIQRVLLCGGGSHNQLLRERIATLLPQATTGITSEAGVDADWLEAMAFAWLAKQRLEKSYGNVVSVTGASRPCILGGIYSPP